MTIVDNADRYTRTRVVAGIREGRSRRIAVQRGGEWFIGGVTGARGEFVILLSVGYPTKKEAQEADL